MSDLYTVTDDLPADLADLVVDEPKPATEDTEDDDGAA
jgi:hypothetical protein